VVMTFFFCAGFLGLARFWRVARTLKFSMRGQNSELCTTCHSADDVYQ
jgi:nitrate/TMAO reductase-like tetraheme cytochrome c subunit